MSGRGSRGVCSCDQAVGRQKRGVSGDAKRCGKINFDIWEMGSAVNTLHGVVIVSGYDKMNLSCGVSGELVAIMRNVIGLCVVCDVVAGGSVERVLKGMK